MARRCDGRASNVSHTKFLSPISMLQPRLNPASCHFSCVQIEIELCSARNERKTGAQGEGKMTEREPDCPPSCSLQADATIAPYGAVAAAGAQSDLASTQSPRGRLRSPAGSATAGWCPLSPQCGAASS